MSPSEKSHIFRNLAKYVRTGMGIEKACESMLAQPGVTKGERQIYHSIQEGVMSGLSIADAMEKSSRLDALDFQMLSAAERSGRLDGGLNHLAAYYERVDQTRRRVRSGLVYPLFLFHFGLIVTTFLGAMLSRFNLNGESKPFLDALWDTGQWAIYLYLSLLVIGIFLVVLRKQGKGEPVADRVLNKIPILGPARRYAALERFTSVFEIFLLAGMKMDESMKAAGEASNSGLIRHVSRIGAKSLKNGEKLAVTFFKNPAAFPNDFARGIASAEEAGMLDSEFARWKQFYSESLTEAMNRLGEWIPKLVYLGCLFAVAAMIIRVGMAYLKMLNGITDF